MKSTLQKVLRSIYSKEKNVVFEKVIDNLPLGVETKVKVDIRLVTRDDIPKFPMRYKNIEAEAYERFAAGNICFAAYIHDEMVHHKWFALHGSIPQNSELERSMRISPDSTYEYDDYTVPKYRGLGISPKVMEKALQYLSKMGIKKAYSYVRTDNFASLRVKQKETFREIGTITNISILGLRLNRVEVEKEADYKKLRLMYSFRGYTFP